MIKSVEIKNFRGIKNLKVDFTDRITVISGDNALGKSTILNAVNWVLTNSLFSDLGDIIDSKKFGSIKPVNMLKGNHVSVTLDVDDTTFTKIYEEKYETNSDVLKGHSTRYAINGIRVSNEKEFYSRLYTALNYVPKINVKGVREINLLCDPLYALLKLDSSALRELLVALGCTIDDEVEFIKNNSEYFKSKVSLTVGDSLLNRCLNLRTHLKSKLAETLKTINVNDAKLEEYQDVEVEYDDSKMTNLKAEIKKVQQEMLILEASGTTQLVSSLKHDLELTKVQKDGFVESQKQVIKAEAEKLKVETNNKLNNLKMEYDNAVLLYEKEKSKYEEAVKDCEVDLKAAEVNVEKAQLEVDRDNAAITKAITDSSDLTVKYRAKLDETYDGFVECETCGCLTPINPEAKKKFDKEKEEFIAFAKKRVVELRQKQKEAEEALNESRKALQSAQTIASQCRTNLNKAKNDLLMFEARTNKPLPQPEASGIRTAYNMKIDALKVKADTIDTSMYDARIIDLESKIRCNEEAAKSAVLEQVNALKLKETELDAKLNDEYMIMSKSKTKADISKTIETAVAEYNDIDHNLQEVNEVIQKIIKTINDKAYQITGIKFVLLEDNLSNDGCSYVCYAVNENGVKFEHINTKEKTFFGIKFCNKVRELLFPNVDCKLPYLMDKMEQLGRIELLAELDVPQIICTRVSAHPELSIKYLK